MKEKIKEQWDNLCYNARHLRGNILYFFEGLGRWFSYFNVLRKSYDFDYSSIINVEEKQITRVRNSILKYQHHVNYERDVYWMNMALKLLAIIQEDGCSILKGPGFVTKPFKDGLSELVPDPESKWIMPIYVNTRNAKRFMTIEMEEYEDPRIGPLMKDHLRIEKAWTLYYRLRSQYTRQWWD